MRGRGKRLGPVLITQPAPDCLSGSAPVIDGLTLRGHPTIRAADVDGRIQWPKTGGVKSILNRLHR